VTVQIHNTNVNIHVQLVTLYADRALWSKSVYTIKQSSSKNRANVKQIWSMH